MKLVALRTTLPKEFLSEEDRATALQNPRSLLTTSLPSKVCARTYGWHEVHGCEPASLGFCRLPKPKSLLSCRSRGCGVAFSPPCLLKAAASPAPDDPSNGSPGMMRWEAGLTLLVQKRKRMLSIGPSPTPEACKSTCWILELDEGKQMLVSPWVRTTPKRIGCPFVRFRTKGIKTVTPLPLKMPLATQEAGVQDSGKRAADAAFLVSHVGGCSSIQKPSREGGYRSEP